jgi:succinyl-CoA synthetase alpha subunit
MMGGRVKTAYEYYRPGYVGIMSRSGGITSAIAYTITNAGLGQSTAVHVGGDPVVGLGFPDLLPIFEEDDQTQLVVMYGEIGTTQEERAAGVVAAGQFTKPLICFIGGAAAHEGTRFSHAGAIVEGGRGSHADKIACLRQVGAHIVSSVEEIPDLTGELLH